MTARHLLALPTWRIVVAVAHDDARAKITSWLEAGGPRVYEIVSAATTVEALAATADLQAGALQCMVIDEHLPGGDTLTVLAALRQANELAVCPIIVITGTGDYRGARAFINAGAQDCIDLASLTSGSLARMLENAVERWALAAALRVRERAVQESEERLRVTLEASTIGLWAWDLRTDAVDWSSECYRIHGLREDEFDQTGVGFFALVVPEHRERVRERIDRAFEQQTMFECEFQVLRPRAEPLWVASRGRATYDQDGQPIFMRGIIADVTERRRTAAELARSERFGRSIVEASADCVAGLDRDGNLMWMNENGQSMLAITDFAALKGRRWSDLWADEEDGATSLAEVAVRDALAGSVGRFRGRCLTLTSGARWWDIVVTPIQSLDREVDELLTVARDVTELRLAEQHAQRAALDAAAAAEANAKFKFFFEQGAHFTGLLALDGTLIEGNRMCFEACGFSPEVELGRPFWECGWWNRSEAQVQRIREGVQSALAGRAVRLETIYFLADGSQRDVDLTLAPVTDEAGRIIFVAPTGIDITERKATQEALALREAEFRTLADHMSQLAWMTDASGWIYWYNRRWFDYTGTTLEEMQGWGWRAVHHPDHVERVVAKISKCFETGELWEDLFPLRGADGNYRWFLSRAVPIRDATGQIVRWLGTNTDVTDRQVAEEKLRERERELQTLTDNSPDILTRFDAQFRQVFVNAAVEQATGRPRALVLGKSYRELGVSAELCDRWEHALAQTFASGKLGALEFEDASPLGWRNYAARLVPEFDDAGRVSYVLAVTHDITAQKHYEQTLADQDRRKDEFLATLAHELRNPLAPIRSGLAVVRLARSEEEVRRVLDMMERQLVQLVDLVDDLLDVSRVSQGKIKLRIVRMRVRDAVEAAIEACQAILEGKRQRLSVELPSEPLVVLADQTRLVQIVVNLITNAVKYSEPDRLIQVVVRRVQDDAIITVIDEGVGIAAEVLPTIWDMFTQVRDTLAMAQGGLGIGLALVKRLVAMHGGSVAASSPGPGGGSSFSVQLPMANAPGEEGAAERVLPSPAPAIVSARRVLVVDDNQDSAEVLAMVLEHDGHEVATAHNGLDALALVPGFRPDVMLVDIGLPGLNGYEVARRLRGDPATADLLLIALTGWGSDEDRRRSAEAGFDVHLTKPVDARAIRQLIAQGRGPAPTP